MLEMEIPNKYNKYINIKITDKFITFSGANNMWKRKKIHENNNQNSGIIQEMWNME